MKEKENLNKENEQKEKKKGFVAWWGGLTNPIKGLIIGGTTVALASAIVFPTLAATIWKKPSIIEVNTKFERKEGTNYLFTDEIEFKKGNQYKIYTKDFTQLGTSGGPVCLMGNAGTYYITKFGVKNVSTNKTNFKERSFTESSQLNEHEYSQGFDTDAGYYVCYITANRASVDEKELYATVTFDENIKCRMFFC